MKNWSHYSVQCPYPVDLIASEDLSVRVYLSKQTPRRIAYMAILST
jgi:hypothetical protein